MMEYTLHDPQTLTIQLAGRTTTVAHILSDGSLALHYGEGDQVIGTTNAYLDPRTGAVFAFYQGTWKLTFDTETGKVAFEPSGDAVLPQELFPLGAQVLVSEDGKNYDLLMPTTQRTQKQGFLWMDTKQYHLPEGVQSVRICPTAGFQDPRRSPPRGRHHPTESRNPRSLPPSTVKRVAAILDRPQGDPLARGTPLAMEKLQEPATPLQGKGEASPPVE